MGIILKQKDGIYYISIFDLRKLGFDYPEKGTEGILRTFHEESSNWYKFHEKKENWDGIFVSPFLSDIGKKNIGENEFYIEFSPNTFSIKTKN